MKNQETVRLDDAIEAVRDQQVDPKAAETSQARVWSALAREAQAPPVETIRGCADVRTLLPAYARHELTPARTLLVDDHLRECAACRQARAGAPLVPAAWRTGVAAPVRRPLQAWHAVAAAAVLGLGLLGYAQRDLLLGVPAGSRAAVQSISGHLYRVADGEASALRPGDELAEGERVRTGRGSQAVLRLRDGSVLEMDASAELSVDARRQDTTVRLQRGNIIVQAAKRRVGHLYVAAEDCTVAVTGTVFSVSRGVKGSRVAVLEGEVRVRQTGQETVLRPGQQVATSNGLGKVPIRQEIAWSRHADQHLAMLAELTSMRRDLQNVTTPGVRYETHLLRGVPANAFIYVAAPNYGESLAQAYEIFEQRVQQSEVLREWWQRRSPNSRRDGPRVAELVSRLRQLGQHVGDEIVVAFVPKRGGDHHVLFLADVRTAGLREFIENGLFAGLPRQPRIAFAANEGQIGATSADYHVLLGGSTVAVSDDPTTLRAAADALAGRTNGLATTAFGARITEAYTDGASLLMAADTTRLHPSDRPGRRSPLSQLQYFIAEHADVDGRARNSAELVFNGPRRGVGSWLGAPAPMGSLDFVSPEATGVAAFVAKSPALIFDDLMNGGSDPAGTRRAVSEFESQIHVRFREDFAAALGSEFAVALDGPLVPTPALLFVAEVYDPVRLEQTLEAFVQAIQEEAMKHGQAGVRLEHEQAGGRTYHVLRGARPGDLPFEMYYAFADGYLVAAPSRALVMNAIAVHEGGRSLARSGRLAAMLPADGRPHVSALMYQNVGGSGALSSLVGLLSPAQQQALQALVTQSRPTLIYAYGEEDRIQVAGDLFSFDPSALALPVLLDQAHGAPARRVR